MDSWSPETQPLMSMSSSHCCLPIRCSPHCCYLPSLDALLGTLKYQNAIGTKYTQDQQFTKQSYKSSTNFTTFILYYKHLVKDIKGTLLGKGFYTKSQRTSSPIFDTKFTKSLQAFLRLKQIWEGGGGGGQSMIGVGLNNNFSCSLPKIHVWCKFGQNKFGGLDGLGYGHTDIVLKPLFEFRVPQNGCFHRLLTIELFYYHDTFST